MLKAATLPPTWKVIVELFGPILHVLDEALHQIAARTIVDMMLQTQRATCGRIPICTIRVCRMPTITVDQALQEKLSTRRLILYFCSVSDGSPSGSAIFSDRLSHRSVESIWGQQVCPESDRGGESEKSGSWLSNSRVAERVGEITSRERHRAASSRCLFVFP